MRMANLLGCPACFRITVGKIFLADGFVQRRADPTEIISEMRFRLLAQAGAHLIWVSGDIRFCILPADDLLDCADRVTSGSWTSGDAARASPGMLSFPHLHQASGGIVAVHPYRHPDSQ